MKKFISLKFVSTFVMTHLYCVECKAKLDNNQHLAINNPLLKLYLCARLGIMINLSDRICVKCRSAFDYWKKKFAEVTERFASISSDDLEVRI